MDRRRLGDDEMCLQNAAGVTEFRRSSPHNEAIWAAVRR